MKFERSSLRSKVARRMFAVFLLCAFLPFAALVFISYVQVGTFFEQRNHRQLRDLAKLFGMDAHERLTFLRGSLQVIASSVAVSGNVPTEESLESISHGHEDQWKALSVIAGGGLEKPVFGSADAFPELSGAEKKRLVSGKVILSLLRVTNGPPRLFMSMLIDPRRPDSARLVGEIKESYLWGIGESRLMPSFVQPCVQSVDGVRLTCSSAALGERTSVIKEEVKRSSIGDLEWSHQGRDYLASYWTVPMEFEFGLPGWVVVLATTKEGAFTSIAELQKTFVLGIVVSLGLSILLAIFQIRKRLVPVEKLQEGTRRIGHKEFDFRVLVRSNDEFEELAGSINTMAGELDRQFRTLEKKAEIDRAILSLLNTDKIVHTVLTRLMAIFPCDTAHLILMGSGNEATSRLFTLDSEAAIKTNHRDGVEWAIEMGRPGDGQRTVGPDLVMPACAADRSQENTLQHRVAAAKIPVLFDGAEIEALRPELGIKNRFASAMAAPLMVKENVLGVLVFYSKEPGRFGAQDRDFLGGLTGQAAVAIYNSQLFERTQRQATELEKANRAKDEFLGVISHELRTPLNVMVGYLNMVRENLLGEVNPDQAKALDTVAKHSDELLEIIESIMDATKIETGAVVTDFRVLNLSDFLDNLKTKYDIPLGKEITLKWHHSFELPSVTTDAGKLARILQNLIGNAIKFTPEGQVTISAVYKPEQECVEFGVADTGIGMPQEELPVIFEMFRQLDGSRTREYGGVGLGLYIVKKLADLIGAEITVESEFGAGSTFTLRVPITNQSATVSAGT